MGLPAFCNFTVGPPANLTATLLNNLNTSILLGNDSLGEISVVDNAASIKDVKRIAYTVITPIVCLIGICGNVLNLITLRNRALQTVPFMYIRLVAVFDLVALSLILISSFSMGGAMPYHPWLIFYQSYVELVIINTCLSASLYCALVLTIERYILISHPHLRSASADPKQLAQIKIVCAFMLALLLHIPMYLQYSVSEDNDETTDRVIKSNNRRVMCNEPSASIYYYYTQTRECVRLATVVIMSVLNGVIARKLQLAKQNRRRMTLKQQKARIATGDRKEAALMKSFTEKKLTVLMIAICIIYLIGNLPQAVNMVVHSDAMETKFSYQVFRAFGNVTEVLNHCLNFYVFCIASTEYSRAFLQNCMCMRSVLMHIPCCAEILKSRKPSAASEGGTSVGATSVLNTDVIHRKNIEVSPPNSSVIFNDNTSVHGDKNLVYL